MTPTNPDASDPRPGASGIDPRSPRFVAAITAVVALVVVGLATAGLTTAGLTTAGLAAAAAILLGLLAALSLWSAIAGVRRHPLGIVFRRLVRPRLAPPATLEDPAAPTFAQGVGAVISITSLVVALLAGPAALVVGGALVFVAAFLNSVFDVCLGCHLYTLLVRAGLVRAGAIRRTA